MRVGTKSYLAAQYARLRPRLGHNKALVAVEHSILVAIFHMLQRDQPYYELGADHLVRREDPDRRARSLSVNCSDRLHRPPPAPTQRSVSPWSRRFRPHAAVPPSRPPCRRATATIAATEERLSGDVLQSGLGRIDRAGQRLDVSLKCVFSSGLVQPAPDPGRTRRLSPDKYEDRHHRDLHHPAR